MTEAILIGSGLVFGAICLGVGYLLAKRAKVEKQVRDELDRIQAQVKVIVNSVKDKL